MVASTVIVAIVNYVLNITLGWTLPVEEYGQVGVSQSLIFILVWFLSAGFPWVVTRAIAQAGASGPLDGAAGAAAWRSYKSAWLATAGLTLVIVALLLVAYDQRWLPLEPSYAPLIVLVAVTVAGLGFGAVPNAALQGLFRFGQVSAVRIIEAVTNLTASLALVIAGLGAAGALGGFALAQRSR
jgi:O-antigen/teichoic acid export membrane protein